jgi:methionyl-tRNA formyltransferase
VTTSPLKIIFAGTPEFAAVILEALSLSRHQLIAVYTQPDRASGRGLKVVNSAVKETAIDLNLPIYQPETLKDPREQEILRNLHADVMVVAAYGLILPKAVLAMPRYGCLNIHASLLPRWRGAAPIQRAVMAGDKTSGVTIMQMNEGLDTGDILLKHAYTLREDETSQTLYHQLTKMGAEAIVETLELLAEGKLAPEKQDDALSTHAKKLTKEEALIDWNETAQVIERKVRAFNPWPIAHSVWQGEHVRIGTACVTPYQGKQAPGVIVNASREGIDVATRQDALRILSLQLPGGKMIAAADFYNAHRDRLQVGKLLSE